MERSCGDARAMLSDEELEAVKLAAGALLERFVLVGDNNDRQIASILRGMLARCDRSDGEAVA